jgi:hypothetical protein
MSKMGRGNIFGPKNGDRVQGVLTREGSRLFEGGRKRLAALSGRANVSDADTIEYLARAWRSTQLETKKMRQGSKTTTARHLGE